MKKQLMVALAAFLLTSAFSFAKEPENSRNVITIEATGGLIGLGVNEVITYDFMIKPKFGIGAGVAASQGLIKDINGFLDLKVWKWNFGVGAGYDLDYSSNSFIARAVYQGSRWKWGTADAGLTLGTDWHLSATPSKEYDELGELALDVTKNIIKIIPRFVLGINCKLGL